MTKIPVVLTFDKRIILAGAVTIKSLIDSARPETQYDIYVYHPDINNKTIEEFKNLIKNTHHELHFEKIDKSKFKNCPVDKKGSWNEIVYYRLMIPELLKNYEKAIYSDVDVLIKDDLTELYQTNIEAYDWAGVQAEKNTPNTIGHKYFKENKNDYIYWSGLMLINCKKWREEKTFNKLLENAVKFYDRLKFFDLDLVNITCNKILALPIKYCLLQGLNYSEDYTKIKEYSFLKEIYSNDEINEAKKNPVIIHYAGHPGKPWRFKKVPKDYQKYIDLIPKKLRKYTFRDIRKKLFSKV